MKGILFKPDSIKAIVEGRKTQTRRVIKQAIHEFKSTTGTHREIAGAILPARDSGYVAWWPGESKGLAEFTKRQYKTGFQPRYQVGGVVYVKETHYRYGHWVKNGLTKAGRQKWLFRATDNLMVYFDAPLAEVYPNSAKDKTGWFKRSPLFMPERFARYFILIKDVRAERLQEITEENAKAEGVDKCLLHPPIHQGYEAIPLPLADGKVLYRTKSSSYYLCSFARLWNSSNKDYPWESNPWVWVYEFKGVNHS